MVMKRLLIFSFALLQLLALPAMAAKFDGAKAAEEWYLAHGKCRGTLEADPKAADRACAIRAKLTKALKAHGYCFDDGEQEWRVCRKS